MIMNTKVSMSTIYNLQRKSSWHFQEEKHEMKLIPRNEKECAFVLHCFVTHCFITNTKMLRDALTC